MIEHLHLNRVPHGRTCFEILGFDILLDAKYRAWLLEVNTFPDLAGSSPLDQRLKTELVEDTLHMVGIAARPVRGERGFDERSDVIGREEIARRGNWSAAMPNGLRNSENDII